MVGISSSAGMVICPFTPPKARLKPEKLNIAPPSLQNAAYYGKKAARNLFMESRKNSHDYGNYHAEHKNKLHGLLSAV
jgi:hypothetical protein